MYPDLGGDPISEIRVCQPERSLTGLNGSSDTSQSFWRHPVLCERGLVEKLTQSCNDAPNDISSALLPAGDTSMVQRIVNQIIQDVKGEGARDYAIGHRFEKEHLC